MELSDIELGPKMLACSEGERRFVIAYVFADDGNATEAARLAGYVDNENGAIRRRGHLLSHRPRVREAIEEMARVKFRALLVPTINATAALIKNDKHPDHAGTVKSMLSRLGLAERTGVDVNLSGEVTVNHTDQAIDDLRKLKALGLPREKLLGIFGFSGLERYEKLLTLADQRVPRETGPVIEHEAQGDGGKNVTD
jgi:hypothetical protein